MPELDWDTLGYLDYPNSRHYPHQDKNNLTNEMEYIRGWNRAKVEAENSDMDSEFGRDTYAAQYLKVR